MEERILEILNKNTGKYEDNRYTHTITDYPTAAKEITSHVFQFIDWMMEDCLSEFNYETTEKGDVWYVKDGGLYTLEEIYGFWLNNIKNK